MRLRPSITILAALLASGCATASPVASGPALIERTTLFGNPSFLQARLSPDGQWLAWIAPHQGVLNLWVAPADDRSAARPVTAEASRPIEHYSWGPDSRSLLYIADKAGDENFLIHGVDVATGERRTLTPFERTRAQIVAISNRVPDRILVGLNNRDPRWHDVYSLDLGSGELSLVFRNEGYAAFVADKALNLRVASRARADGGTDFFRIAGGQVEAEPFVSIGLDDAMSTRPLSFTADGATLYWVDSRGRDKAALVAQDVATGRTRVVAEDSRADVGDILVDPILAHPLTGEAQAYQAKYLRSEWIALDPDIEADLELVQSRLGGEVTVTSRSNADDRWTVEVDPVTASPKIYLFDRETDRLTELFVSRPEIEGLRLAPMHPLELRARDGLILPSYLTLPAGSDSDADGRPDQPLPMVLLVHGGPWLRDSFGYDPYHQWLANRGYAVLSVNFRGSAGFGKSFMSAGDREWGGKMHEDLLDAIGWATGRGIAVEDRIAIMGASYGGYATLAGLAFTPEVFACGVDVVGPSNLLSLLAATPPYWESLKRQLYKRVGDPRTAEGEAFLRERSPLFTVDAIRKPLLIAQGANDPRVPRAESDQIAEAMAARNIPVTYLLFPDEGHGLARPENVIGFTAVAENFLKPCLGGRAEPIGWAAGQSSVEVLRGVQHVDGLAGSLAARPAQPHSGE